MPGTHEALGLHLCEGVNSATPALGKGRQEDHKFKTIHSEVPCAGSLIIVTQLRSITECLFWSLETCPHFAHRSGKDRPRGTTRLVCCTPGARWELVWNEADFDAEHWEVEGFLTKGTFEQDVGTPTLSFKNG